MFFMKHALLAVLVVTPLFGLLSTMVVESRMAFFSDALGHSAFTGMAIGALCGFTQPVGAAVVFSLVIALLFTLVRQHTSMASDTAISVFSSAAVALGIFISTLGSQSFTKFNTLLIGDILSVQVEEIGILALLLLLLVLLWLGSYNQMMLSSVHQALADSRGIRVVWRNFLFTGAIAVVVTISMSWVGLLVINALLVLPAAAARNVARNLPQYHLLSVAGGLVCGVAGLMLSYYVGASTGASITLLLALWFFVTLLLRKRR
ncbi:MAG: metal ABC transporter permease [Ruminiclostridium sp.]|nr:metal ABC transporter permease [Ruminiclostridium sp.]